jgi:hypothetical protein
MKKMITGYYSVLLIVAVLAGCCSPKESTQGTSTTQNNWYMKTFAYSDGSGNSYSIDKNSFEYIPVKPENSSTGTYDGGDYVKKVPTASEYQELADAIKAAWETKSDFTDERGKGTGFIHVLEGKDQFEFILKMNSVSKQKIEAVLAKMRKSK